MSKLITVEQIQELGKEFGYNSNSIRAVMQVEAPKGGFLPSGRVTILFERHKFYQFLRLTPSKQAEMIRLHPGIYNPRSGGYIGGEKEWDRLEKAQEFGKVAALKSASWGRGQIMGFNFAAAGFASVQEMVLSFSESEQNQMRGMLRFIKADRRLDLIMRLQNPTLKEWESFAERYNGRNYRDNDYHTKLQNSYSKLVLADLGK
jgi:Protein of unknown function (DUF3380).